MFIVLLTSKLSAHAIATVLDLHELHAEEAIHHVLVVGTTTTDMIVVALATMTLTIVVARHLVMPILMVVAVAVDTMIVIVAMAVLPAEAHHPDAMMHMVHHVVGMRNHMVHREGRLTAHRRHVAARHLLQPMMLVPAIDLLTSFGFATLRCSKV
jgi:uncharacterized integral membrane protein